MKLDTKNKSFAVWTVHKTGPDAEPSFTKHQDFPTFREAKGYVRRYVQGETWLVVKNVVVAHAPLPKD